jgi:hypothetical protein
MRLAIHVGEGDKEMCNKILVGKPEGKRPLGRPRSRWEGNIKTDRNKIVWEDVDWIRAAQNRNRWQIMNLQVL